MAIRNRLFFVVLIFVLSIFSAFIVANLHGCASIGGGGTTTTVDPQHFRQQADFWKARMDAIAKDLQTAPFGSVKFQQLTEAYEYAKWFYQLYSDLIPPPESPTSAPSAARAKSAHTVSK